MRDAVFAAAAFLFLIAASMGRAANPEELLPAGSWAALYDWDAESAAFLEAVHDRVSLEAGEDIPPVWMLAILMAEAEARTYASGDRENLVFAYPTPSGRARNAAERVAGQRGYDAAWSEFGPTAGESLQLAEIHARDPGPDASPWYRPPRPLYLVINPDSSLLLASTNRTEWAAMAGRLRGRPFLGVEIDYPALGSARAYSVLEKSEPSYPIRLTIDRWLAATGDQASGGFLVREILGADKWTGVEAGFAPSLSGAEFEGRIAFGEEKPALFEALGASPPSAILQTVPDGVPCVMAVRLESLRRLFRVWVEALAESGKVADLRMQREAIIEWNSFVGFDFEQELLTRLGPELALAKWGPVQGAEHWVLFVQARDPLVVERALDRLFQRLRLESETRGFQRGLSYRQVALGESDGQHLSWLVDERGLLIGHGVPEVEFLALVAARSASGYELSPGQRELLAGKALFLQCAIEQFPLESDGAPLFQGIPGDFEITAGCRENAFIVKGRTSASPVELLIRLAQHNLRESFVPRARP